MIPRLKQTNRWPLLAIAIFAGLALAPVADAQNKPSVTNASASTPAKPQFRSVWAPTNAVPLINAKFTDNFDNGPSPSWSFHENPAASPYEHAVTEGELVLENSGAILGKADWTNYVVRVRVCLESAQPWGYEYAGIFVRRMVDMVDNPQKKTSFGRYGVTLGCIGGRPHAVNLAITYHDASGTVKVEDLAFKEMTIPFKRWYSFEIELKGSRLRGFVDGELVVEAEDKRLPQGSVFLEAFRTRARFDDFSVQLLP